MIHGDDIGLVLPPRVAPLQVVVVPISYQDTPNQELASICAKIVADLNAAGFRAHHDDRSHTPGWKYNHWELRGVPVRIEFGPDDMERNQCVLVRRDRQRGDSDQRAEVPLSELKARLGTLLDDIHDSLFQKAKQERDSRIIKVMTWDEFMVALEKKCMCLAPWCDEEDCEEAVKMRSSGKEAHELTAEEKSKIADEEKALQVKKLRKQMVIIQSRLAELLGEEIKGTEEEGRRQEADQGKGATKTGASEEEGFGLKAAAKTLCRPFEQPLLSPGTTCFACGKTAKSWMLWGRSY